MSKTIRSARHEAVRRLLVDERKRAGLTQAAVAASLRRYQSFVATVESGQRRVDVVEFLAFAEAIGFDPKKAIKHILRVRT